MTQEPNGSRATIREVMALIEASRKEVLAEIEKLESAMYVRFDAHMVKHEADQETHEHDHRREADRRAGYMRWAVTTIMTGIGTLFAIAWAIGHG